ncbi:Ubiquitin carboxyl-terminal hydrolase 45 [Geranomyces variabilis]|uniref:Ubiquitin carboxyl-terminal hydrolase n=1 Tax=Geranomyces variabilis TaxID=109894 RepID=A0AAD5TLS5_9FUNG|nr:Ubiquitin carboxyl-terminal hydrolase 45 [Geranomyces variabilis]
MTKTKGSKSKAKKAAKKAGSKRNSTSSLPHMFDPEDATGASNDNVNGISSKKCSHLKGAVRIKQLEKQLPSTLKKGPSCTACRKDKDRAKSKAKKKSDDTSGSEDGDGGGDSPLPPKGEPSSLWLCCKCGDLNCGRADESHALKHFESDSKCSVAVNIHTLECWCYACDDEVVSSTNHNQLAAEAKARLQDVLKSSLKDVSAKAVPLVTKAKSKKDVTSPGLTNLGNTCFFNSVMQCIAYTAPLWDVKAKLTLSTAATRRPVTESLLGFLDSMREQRKAGGGSVNPKILFGALSNEWRMYKRMGQQDSHELLRRLLDGVREEQLDRSPGRKPGHQITPVDEVFGGKLCQIIVCDTCQHISYAFEDYLDLSLSIKDEAKDSWGLSSLFSRRKSNTKSPRSSPIPDSSSIHDDDLEDRSEYAKDPENMKLVKTLLEPTAGVVPDSNPTLQQCMAKFFAVETLQGDSVYSCDTCFKLKYGITPAEHRKELEQFKAAHASEHAVSNSESSDTDSSSDDDDVDGVGLSDEPSTPDESPERAHVPEVRIDRSNILAADGSEDGEAEVDPRERGSRGSLSPSEAGITPSTLYETALHSSASSVASTRGSALIPVSEDDAVEEKEGEELTPPPRPLSEGAKSDDEGAEEVFYTPVAHQPAPPTNPTTTTNPTLRGAPQPPERPPVQTRAFKRYLIHTAPEVLVVHLKRFQQVGFGGRTKKLEDVVAFDKELDVGAFLAPADVAKVVESADVADAAASSSEPPPPPPVSDTIRRACGKYRLYGVVVHGGGLFSGHYIAYVCVNGPAIPPPATAITTNGVASAADDESSSDSEWMYCSDSQVRPSSWEEVSKAQAYILMYERIPEA